jgi:hypothetical protein
MVARAGVILVTTVVLAAGAIVGWSYVFGGSGNTSSVNGKFAAALRRATTTTAPPTTTIPPTTTTTQPKPVQPPKQVMPDLGGQSLHIGSSGPIVLAYEQRMKALHFDPGPVDGVYDQDTAYAVETVEKLYNLDRDGSIGPAVRLVLSGFQWRAPLVTKNAEPDRVEIDLDRQVLTLYRGGQIALITTTSTGSGKKFCGGSDGCQYAITPPGKYAFTWHFNGWRTSKLGHLYNPYYFNGGIAVHGYPEVPVYNASHGCSRIPMHIANYFPSLVAKGMPVYVLGTPAAPKGGPITAADVAAAKARAAAATSTTTAAPVTAATTPKQTTTTTAKKTTTTTTKPKPKPTTTTVAKGP